MSTLNLDVLHGEVAGGAVRLERGARLREGARVLVMPLEWLKSKMGPPQPAGRSTKTRRKFQSEDLVGCHIGDGVAATNSTVRERLRRKAR
jgi:hypothetical protein